MSFELTVNLTLTSISIGLPDEAGLAAGQSDMQVSLGVALLVSSIRTQQDGQPLAIPVGNASMTLSKEQAEHLAETITEAAEKLPDSKTSDVLVASDMSAVAKTAEELGRYAR